MGGMVEIKIGRKGKRDLIGWCEGEGVVCHITITVEESMKTDRKNAIYVLGTVFFF